ncbi:sulfotransferase family 2 domain-containing protein [Profundibacter sp.]
MDKALKRSILQRKIYFASKSLYKLTGILPAPWSTPHSVDGKPVYFIHIPKSAGSSLKTLLGCRIGKTTHAMPRLVMRKRQWHESFIITAVREPFDRFVSSYSYMVKQQGSGVLNRMYGEKLVQLDPFEYLEFIQQFPEKLGFQTQWTHYPSRRKPTADLILRVEESDRWRDQLRAAGITNLPRKVERRNASRQAGQGLEDVLGLNGPDLTALERRVKEVFAVDYEALGY